MFYVIGGAVDGDRTGSDAVFELSLSRTAGELEAAVPGVWRSFRKSGLYGRHGGHQISQRFGEATERRVAEHGSPRSRVSSLSDSTGSCLPGLPSFGLRIRSVGVGGPEMTG